MNARHRNGNQQPCGGEAPKRKLQIITQDVARALKTEGQSLQKIHANLRANLHKLQAEEAAIKAMIRRELQRLRAGAHRTAADTADDDGDHGDDAL